MHLNHLADFKPPSSSRAWLSAPHPTLPLVATACSDKTVRVYSLQNFTLHSTLDGGHKRSVRSVAWKPTQKKGQLALVTGSFDATAGIWRRDESETREADFTESAGADDEEHDWEFSLVLEGHDSEIKSVAFSPSGQYLATCSRDKSVWIWEEIGEEGDDEWETVAVLQEHDGDVKYISWCGDDGKSEVLASASYDDTIRLWREDEDREWGCVAVLQEHQGTVWAVEWEGTDYPGRKELLAPIRSRSTPEPVDTETEDFSPPPRLLSCSADNTIKVWQRDVSSSPQRIPAGRELIPSTMRMSFTAGERWDCIATLPKAHDGDIYSIAWSHRSGLVVSTGIDSKIVVYGEFRAEPVEEEEQLEKVNEGEVTSAAKLNGTKTVRFDSTPDECCGGKDVHDHAAAGDACCGGKSHGSKSSCCGGHKKKTQASPSSSSTSIPTEWRIIASMSKAHGPFEVNHVAWTKRFDGPAKNSDTDEEIIISTGDDGSVIAWSVVDGEGEPHRVGRETGKGWGDAVGNPDSVPDLV